MAGFLGASNLLEGEVKESNDGMSTVALTSGGAVTAAERPDPGGRAGARIKVGVRPEKVAITRGNGDAPSGTNGIGGTRRR